MIDSITITDEDIYNIERIMGKNFRDDEVRMVLKELGNCNIIACPGAGKTTTLIAKLAMLSEKLPSSQGICVLSHTNAAREEIEKTLGKYSSKVLAYTNYVGTIQSFIDKYLAIPAYNKLMKKKIVCIDDEQYNRIVRKHSNTLLKYGTRSFIGRKNNGDYNIGLEKLRYSYNDLGLCIYDNGKEKPFYCGKDADSYVDAKNFKNAITTLGYITFYDAYSLANKYLESFKELSEVISKRFPIVFIDEMQDTSNHQLDLLYKIFNKSVIQLIGDKNQSIYGEVGDIESIVWENLNKKTLNISKSYRMSTSIAMLCKNVAVNRDENLVGNVLRKNCSNTIFLFDDENKDRVLIEYCKLIKEMDLNEGSFYAIGSVGKENEDPNKYSIGSYFKEYNRNSLGKKRPKNYKGYFIQAQNVISIIGDNSIAINSVSDKIKEGILSILWIAGFKSKEGQPYNSRTLNEKLKEKIEDYLEFNKTILNWSKDLILGEDLEWTNICKQTIEIIKPIGNLENINEDIKLFIESQTTEEEIDDINSNNVFRYNDDDGFNINIILDTIHSVKGQTHQATLLLETFNYDYNLKSILPYLINERPKKIGKRDEKRLYLSYVALSRATELVCMAMRKEDVTEELINKLVTQGWSIKDICI